MLVFKNAIVTLSLGAVLIIPAAVSADGNHYYTAKSVDHTSQTAKHDSDDKSKHVEAKDHDQKDESHNKFDKSDDSKKGEVKGEDDHDKAHASKHNDADDHAKKDIDDKSHCEHKTKPVVNSSPAQVVPGKGSVLSTAITPVAPAAAPQPVSTASTLPTTGAATDIAVAVAAASALAAYMYAKRRQNQA